MYKEEKHGFSVSEDEFWISVARGPEKPGAWVFMGGSTAVPSLLAIRDSCKDGFIAGLIELRRQEKEGAWESQSSSWRRR